MAKKQYRFVKIPDATCIPVLGDLTPEEEKEIIAQHIAQLDPAQLEAECRELIRLKEEGKLVSVEQLLRDLDEPDETDQKASA